MKLTYLVLISAAVLSAGCSKPAPSGNVATNTSDSKTSTAPSTTSTTTTTGGTTGTDTQTSTTPPSSPPAATTTTGNTAPPASTPADPKAGTPAPKGAPAPTPAPGTTPPAGAAPAPGTPGQPTPEQIAAMRKRAEENGKKAAGAKKEPIDGIKGTYHGYVDEAKIPANIKSQPGYADQLAKFKAMEVVAANDGSIKLVNFPNAPKEVLGITAKIDGKPAFVISIPDPKPGVPPKQFTPVLVKDSGNTIQFGPFVFKH